MQPLPPPPVMKWAAYGIVGGVAYCIAATTMLEILFPVVTGAVQLSYGQIFGMVSLPGCAVLGALNGVSIASYRWSILSPLLLGTMAIVGGYTVMALWKMQMATYGPDRSHVIVFAPLLALCGLTVYMALMLGLRLIIDWVCAQVAR